MVAAKGLGFVKASVAANDDGWEEIAFAKLFLPRDSHHDGSMAPPPVDRQLTAAEVTAVFRDGFRGTTSAQGPAGLGTPAVIAWSSRPWSKYAPRPPRASRRKGRFQLRRIPGEDSDVLIGAGALLFGR